MSCNRWLDWAGPITTRAPRRNWYDVDLLAEDFAHARSWRRILTFRSHMLVVVRRKEPTVSVVGRAELRAAGEPEDG